MLAIPAEAKFYTLISDSLMLLTATSEKNDHTFPRLFKNKTRQSFASESNLSLRTMGQRFHLATMSLTPGYFYR